MYIYTCTKGTVCTCTSTMYGSVQCDAYTHTYIHVLKGQCVHVHVHQQCMVVYSSWRRLLASVESLHLGRAAV